MTRAQHIHLDHNAGTVVDPRVLARFSAIEQQCPGNPASVHAAGRRAAAVVEAARAQVAAALRAVGVPVEADEVVFCSGGTEANNCAVRGLGDPGLPVLLAPVEHPSVLVPAQRRGVVTWLVDGAGHAIVARPTTRIGLVCLVHAQSEVGTVQPVVAAADLAVNLQVPLHVDAAQSLGRLPLADLARADSIALSPHKAGGLRGTGALVVRSRARELRPLLLGGGQEHGRRAGTLSPALIAATALAIELAVRETVERVARMATARDAFNAALLGDRSLRCRLLTPSDALPNTSMITFAGVDGRNLLPALDLEGIAASHGSACSSGSPQPPAVLAAMGLDEPAARASVRFSFGRDDDASIGDAAAARVAAVIARLQKKN